jgi:hypothetical protein
MNQSTTPFVWPDEFIHNDMRNQKKTPWQSYEISNEFFHLRHATTLPAEFIKNKSVLDLGSYLGATGYWVLSHGCADYTGVELISQYANQSQQYLGNHFDSGWRIVEQEIQDFLAVAQKVDIVIAWGVFNTFINPISVLEQLLLIGDYIVIDTAIPWHLQQNCNDETVSAIVEINTHSCMLQARAINPATFQGSRISLRAIELIGNRYGFELITSPYQELKQAFPDTYGPQSTAQRSMAVLKKNPSYDRPKTYRDLYVKQNLEI